MANDHDPDGDAISFDGVLNSFGINVADNGDGTLTITGSPDYNGAASFTYSIRDPEGLTSQATVSFNILPVNDAPIAVDDMAGTTEDTAIVIPILDLLSNDSDPDGHNIQITAFADGMGGTISEDGVGNVIFTPDTDFNGIAYFTYTLTDSTGATANGRVNVTISPVNDAPVIAVPLSDYSVDEDMPVVIGLPAGAFTDVDSENLTLSAQLSDGSPLPGWLSFDGQTFSGTPPTDFNGTLEISVIASDGELSASDSFILTVNAVNDAPVVDQVLADLTIDEDTPINHTLASNAFTDVDGDALTLSATLADGSDLPAWLSFDGAVFTGQPPENFNGSIDVVVTASDGSLSASQGFSIIVQAVNDQPIAGAVLTDQNFDEDSFVEFALPVDAFSDVDGDDLTLTATLANGAALPAWLGFDGTTFSGQPPQDFNGQLSIMVSASDGEYSAEQSFDLIINPVNDAPVFDGVVDDIVTNEDNAFSATLPDALVSDTENDDVTLTLRLADGTAAPSWIAFDGTTISGTPPQDYYGVINLQLVASDGQDETTLNFDLIVNSVNDAPVAQNDHVSTLEDQVLVIPILTLLENDFDVENNSFQLTEISAVVGGTATLDGMGNVIFTPDTDYNGSASFTYHVVDIFGAEGQAEVIVDITPVNDAPRIIAEISDFTVAEDNPIVIPVPEGAFTDVEGSPLTVTATLLGGAPLPAWLSFENGLISGTPPENYNGSMTIVLTASDGELETSQSFELNITPVNDAPTLLIPLSNRYVTEDEPFDILLQQNAFSDPEGDAITLSASLDTGEPLPEWITFDPVAVRLFGTPPQDYTGSIEILISASDGQLTTSNAFTFTVFNVNDAPILVNPIADQNFDEDTPVEFAVPEDTFDDIDGEELTLTAFLADGQPLPEWLSFENGVLSGFPPENFHGQFDITIQAADTLAAVSDTFTLTINSIEDAPVANNDYGFSVNAGGSVEITFDEVLANDFDPDGNEVTLVSVQQGANGSVATTAEGTIVYTPNDEFFGFDSFRIYHDRRRIRSFGDRYDLC